MEELSAEELRELVRRQRTQQEIKQENHRIAVKRERAATTTIPGRPLKTSRTEGGNVVFHLDSDEDEKPARPVATRRKVNTEIEVVDLN